MTSYNELEEMYCGSDYLQSDEEANSDNESSDEEAIVDSLRANNNEELDDYVRNVNLHGYDQLNTIKKIDVNKPKMDKSVNDISKYFKIQR